MTVTTAALFYMEYSLMVLSIHLTYADARAYTVGPLSAAQPLLEPQLTIPYSSQWPSS